MNTTERQKGQPTQCIDCKKEIPSHAIKCAECGAFQNWLRHLQFSTSILALIIALISVTGLVVPLLVNTFKQDTSEINVAIQSAKLKAGDTSRIANEYAFVWVNSWDAKIRLLVTNSGNRSGFIDSVTIKLGLPKFKGSLTAKVITEAVLNIKPSQAVITPGSFALIDVVGQLKLINGDTYIYGRGIRKDNPGNLNVTEASTNIKIINYNSREEFLELNLPVGDWEIEL